MVDSLSFIGYNHKTNTDDNNNMKASTTFDITQKARIYHTLAQMTSSFSSIVRYCEELEQAGALTRKTKRRFQAFAVEVQAEINIQVLEHIDRVEAHDWHTSGKVRENWEKYLRGPELKQVKHSPKAALHKKANLTTDEHG